MLFEIVNVNNNLHSLKKDNFGENLTPIELKFSPTCN